MNINIKVERDEKGNCKLVAAKEELSEGCPMDLSLGLSDRQVARWCKEGCSVACKELAKDYIARCVKLNNKKRGLVF